MTDVARVTDYFTRSAAAFDSLYSEHDQGAFMRWVNRRYRGDIYERFTRSLAHFQHYQLSSCLDIGCGSGRYARALLEVGVRRVVGVDVSAPMVELARQHTAGLDGAELIVADFASFETAERFDAVLAMGFFDYVAEPAHVLDRMRALTTHSVVASFPSRHLYRTPIRRLRYWLKRCPVYFYDRDQIDALGGAAGFVRTEIEKIPGAGMDYFVTFLR